MPGGWFTDDMHPKFIDSIEDFQHRTTGAVLVSEVRLDGATRGYLWADDAADAAGFVPARAGGEAAVNSGVSWSLRLRNAKSRGLTPSAALEEIIADGPVAAGEPQPLEPAPVPFATLQERAGPSLEPPYGEAVRRR